MKPSRLSIAGKTTLLYLFIGTVYIIVSDTVLLDLENNISSKEITNLQTIKGISYIVASGLLLYFLIRFFIRKLKTSEKQYFDLFRLNPLPMIILDSNEKLTLQVNRSARNLMGFDKTDSLNRIDDFLKKIQILNKLKKIAPDNVLSFSDKEGNHKIVSVNSINTTFELKEATLIIMEDVTEREMSRHRIVELNNKLQKEADQKNELVNQLVGQNRDLEEYAMILSHYLREPIVEIMGLTDYMIKTKKLEEETLRHLKSATNKLDTVIKNTNETIATKTYEANKAKPIKLREILSQAKERVKYEIENLNGRISINVPDDIIVYGNDHFLRSAVSHLLNNAIRFRSDATINIDIGSEIINHACRINITDNGIGFDAETHGNDIFKMYKRLHRDKSGRGFGLYLVKQQIEMMDGEISVSSTPEAGTTFIITLPTSQKHYL